MNSKGRKLTRRTNRNGRSNGKARHTPRTPFQAVMSFMVWASLITLSIGIYAGPMILESIMRSKFEPVLDEVHLIGRANHDVNGISNVLDLLQNDFWARSLHSEENSHKIWRPLTVLTMRYLNNHGKVGWLWWLSEKHVPPVLVHRVVNVLIHTSTSVMVSLIAVRMFPSKRERFWLSRLTEWMSFLWFALHPAHVEAVANAANRPHLLALFFTLSSILHATTNNDTSTSSIMSDPFNILRFFLLLLRSGLLWTAGLLSCEIAVFQLPAVAVTVTAIHWRRGIYTLRALVTKKLTSYYFTWIIPTLLYLFVRWKNGIMTLVPFALDEERVDHLVGTDRWRSYGYVVAIHMGKTFGIDPIGFSHEYARGCIDPLEGWTDLRVWVVLGLVFGIFTSTMDLVFDRKDAEPKRLWAMALSWMATLLPVSGGIRMGTLIADRMVLPSTVVPAWIIGHWCANAVVYTRYGIIRCMFLLMILFFLGGFWGLRVVNRTSHWSHHPELLFQTLETCPKSAKNLLQLSQAHSDRETYPELYDLDKAYALVFESFHADQDYCQVHYQFANIFAQQRRFREMEPKMTQAMVCPATTDKALEFWNDYWPRVTPVDVAASRREQVYLKWIRNQPGQHAILRTTSSGARDEL